MSRRWWLAGLILCWIGCRTTVAPLPDLGIGTPGDRDSGSEDMEQPSGDPGTPGDPGGQDPAAGDKFPSEVSGEGPGDDPGQEIPADAGASPIDPCGTEENPQCLPLACRTAAGRPGTCREADDASCRCVEDPSPVECRADQDCVNRFWMVGCQGRWACVRNRCIEVCSGACGDQACSAREGESPFSCPDDCMAPVPCQDPTDCPFPDSWCALAPNDCVDVGVCDVRPEVCPRIYDPVCGCDGRQYANACLAAAAGVGVRSEGPCPARECSSPRDCTGRPWLVDCVGRWECTGQGTCGLVCGSETCGDGLCDEDKGEDAGSCPRDCRKDLCEFQSVPFCLPTTCQRADGSLGRCGTDREGRCRCGPRFGSCSENRDCIGQVWPLRCIAGGRWECQEGNCDPSCGPPCGDGRCDPSLGEDLFSCPQDCPSRSDHCDDGSEPVCEMVPPVCGEGEVLAHQNGCFACVNPLTCRPWGRSGCDRDADCPPEHRCAPCGTSSCARCEDCVPACIGHGCPTEPVPLCKMMRPDCGTDAVAVVQDGCWVCVDRLTCR